MSQIMRGLGRSARRLGRRLSTRAIALTGGHLLAAFVVCLVVAAGLAITAYLTGNSDPQRITGSFTALGPVDFKLRSAPGEAISPVCGCYKVKHRKDWRGVAFASRSVQISRESENPDATYVISAASPEGATWAPQGLFFSAQLLTFESTRGSGLGTRFNAPALAKGRTPSSWRLVKREHLPPQAMVLMTTDRPLNVDMLGPTPVGAWIPSAGGHVSLDFTEGLTANAPLRGELREVDAHQDRLGALSHPLVDFLGPDVLVWTRDPRVLVENGSREIAASHKHLSGEIVTALLIHRPPFATRVAAMPLLLPPRLVHGLMAWTPEKTSGPYRLRLRGKPLEPPDYERIQWRFRNHNTFWLRNLSGWFLAPRREGKAYALEDCAKGYCVIKNPEMTIQHGQSMEFRYPPRPPAEQGFTVFGPIRSLRMKEAKGALSSQGSWTVPKDVRLRDVTLLEPEDGALPVPADERGYELDLSASASGSVEGEPLIEQETLKEKIPLALLIITGLATVAALYFGVVAYANRRK